MAFPLPSLELSKKPLSFVILCVGLVKVEGLIYLSTPTLTCETTCTEVHVRMHKHSYTCTCIPTNVYTTSRHELYTQHAYTHLFMMRFYQGITLSHYPPTDLRKLKSNV